MKTYKIGTKNTIGTKLMAISAGLLFSSIKRGKMAKNNGAS